MTRSAASSGSGVAVIAEIGAPDRHHRPSAATASGLDRPAVDVGREAPA